MIQEVEECVPFVLFASLENRFNKQYFGVKLMIKNIRVYVYTIFMFCDWRPDGILLIENHTGYTT